MFGEVVVNNVLKTFSKFLDEQCMYIFKSDLPISENGCLNVALINEIINDIININCEPKIIFKLTLENNSLRFSSLHIFQFFYLKQYVQ